MSSNEKFPNKEERQIFFNRLFRKIFLEDWLTKLVALLITLALWYGVSGFRAPKTVRLRAVALNLQVTNNVEITNSPVTEVDIVVTGDKRKTETLNSRDLTVLLDLTNVQPGDQMINLTPENVNLQLPTGVKLDEIQPNKIAVKIEPVEEKEINVKAEIEGNVPEGFEIYDETVVPAKVRVRAPLSYIKSLNFVSTEKISVEEKTADFALKQVALSVSNPKATILDTAVDVYFRIGEKRVEKSFNVSVKADEKTKTVKVTLYGAQSLLQNLTHEKLQVSIIKNDAGNETAQVNLPEELQGKIQIKETKIN
ncbi:MAG TPA: CdaR family protein [Pyrinomonadaceae bacterium]|nr:CdaR family protein [Pyrinomonadaceae bacterium]